MGAFVIVLAAALALASWAVLLALLWKAVDHRALRAIAGSIVSTQLAGFPVGHLRGFSTESILFMSALVAGMILVVTLGRPERMVEPKWLKAESEITEQDRKAVRKYQVAMLLLLALGVSIYTVVFG